MSNCVECGNAAKTDKRGTCVSCKADHPRLREAGLCRFCHGTGLVGAGSFSFRASDPCNGCKGTGKAKWNGAS